MVKRWQEAILREEIKTRRGVHLTGARQCGKTTLAEFVAQNEMRHLTLDDDRLLKAAKDDPISFVDRRDGRTLVIDEIQKAVELLNAIKIRLDHDPSPSQYLITGSSNLIGERDSFVWHTVLCRTVVSARSLISSCPMVVSLLDERRSRNNNRRYFVLT